MSIGDRFGALWRGFTGGHEGFRQNARAVVEATEKKLVALGYDSATAFRGGLAEELINVGKLLPTASADPEKALQEAGIFTLLEREEAIRVFLDYLSWRVYRDAEAHARLKMDLGALIEQLIAEGSFDPSREAARPSFAWSAFMSPGALEKALEEKKAAERRRPWEKSPEERQAAASALRAMADEWYEKGKSSVIVEGRPPDKIHLHCMLRMLQAGWRHLVMTYGHGPVGLEGASDRGFELRPFLALDPTRGREAAREYVVWRMFPNLADEVLVKEVVRDFASGPAGEEGWIIHAEPGHGGIYWLDLVKGDRLVAPWNTPEGEYLSGRAP
jgi:hypothetical protein